MKDHQIAIMVNKIEASVRRIIPDAPQCLRSTISITVSQFMHDVVDQPIIVRQYLMLTEDGSISHHAGEEPPAGSIEGCDSGVCELLDITDPAHPMIYALEGWTDLDFTEMKNSDT